VYLNAGPLVEVSLHPEDTATRQIDRGFPVIFLGSRENAEFESKFNVAMPFFM
jgi:hypothetical protein